MLQNQLEKKPQLASACVSPFPAKQAILLNISQMTSYTEIIISSKQNVEILCLEENIYQITTLTPVQALNVPEGTCSDGSVKATKDCSCS